MNNRADPKRSSRSTGASARHWPILLCLLAVLSVCVAMFSPRSYEDEFSSSVQKSAPQNAVDPIHTDPSDPAQEASALADDPAAADSSGTPEPSEEVPTQAPLSRAEIQEVIDAISQQYGAIGVQVAIIDNGRVTDTYAYGWATKDTDPMTADHKIRVASISKVIIGITAMLLQEDGVIDIDADIGTYWNTTARNPAYPEIPITIRSILTHTSSIISYDDDYSTDYSSIRNRLAYGYTDTKPGDISSHCYNNYAFRVLGSTLEIASSQRIDDILNEKLFDILDIDASFASGDIRDTDMLATLYRDTGEVARSVEAQQKLHLSDTPGESGIYFAGGLTISAADLAKLVSLLVSDGVYDGQQLLSSASVELMEEYMTEPLADGSYQALPLFYYPGLYGREGIYFHTGDAYGVYNCLSYDPATGDGVVVLTTGATGTPTTYDVYPVCDEINRCIYELMLS